MLPKTLWPPKKDMIRRKLDRTSLTMLLPLALLKFHTRILLNFWLILAPYKPQILMLFRPAPAPQARAVIRRPWISKTFCNFLPNWTCRELEFFANWVISLQSKFYLKNLKKCMTVYRLPVKWPLEFLSYFDMVQFLGVTKRKACNFQTLVHFHFLVSK